MPKISEIIEDSKSIKIRLQKLIKSYNKEFPITLSEFTLIAPKCYNDEHPFKKQLECFYNNYNYHKEILNYILELISSLNYSLDDLYIKLNRSPTYITDYYSIIIDMNGKLKDFKISITNNIDYLVNEFLNVIKERTNTITITDDIIEFILDAYNNLDVTIQLIQLFVELNLIKANQIAIINDKIIKIRNKILDIPTSSKIVYKSKVLENKLQRFMLTPIEMDSTSLSEIMFKLFGHKAKDITIKSLSSVLASSNKQNNNNYGIIIIYNNNNDIYFNLSNIFNKELTDQFSKHTGTNKKYIDTFNILKLNYNDHTDKEDQLISINVNEKTEQAYVLWTSNCTTFKYLDKPIEKSIIDKLMRNEASEYIAKYNLEFEKLIETEIDTNLKSEFRKIKYYDFSETISEEDYLKNLNEIILQFLQSLTKIPTIKTLNDLIVYVNSNKSFDNDFNQLLLKHPPIKINDTHTNIMFIFEISKIAKKIKKEFVDLSIKDLSISIKEFSTNFNDVIEYAIGANDNIYTKVINSHYLAELQNSELTNLM